LHQAHPGHLHFATDAWTLPNHHAFIAWTIHLEYQGKPLSLLLDIAEVAESHTSVTMANAFQDMLIQFGLMQKVCSQFAGLCIMLMIHKDPRDECR